MMQNESNPQKQFQVGRLFVRQQRFEADTPAIFKNLEMQAKKASEENKELKPDNRLELKIDVHALEEQNLHETVLTLKLVATADTLELYTTEVSQVGIFVVKDYTQEESAAILNGYAVSVLYPYATQVLSNMIQQGGFLAQPLPPINFDALYQQKKAQGQATNSSTKKVIPVEGELVH